MQKSYEHYEMLLDSCPVPIILVSRKGIIINVNLQTLEALSLTKKQNIIDKNINDFNEYIKINDFKLSNIDKFTRDTFSKNISEYIFKLDVNTLSEPISYDDLGFYLFKVNEVSDEKVIDFGYVLLCIHGKSIRQPNEQRIFNGKCLINQRFL